jgi:tRNA pseudouridine13 synthase
MKIKVRPEDFVVRELIDIRYSEDGPYRIYLLAKRHWNTMDAIMAIARHNKVPAAKIGCGGRKDRHALTYQYISIPRQYELFLEMQNVEFSFMGFADDYVSPAILEGNFFEITLRKIRHDEKQSIKSCIEQIRDYGFPNYFDDQRFGSVSSSGEFMAEKIIKKHYKGALKLYITATYKEDKRHERERKDSIMDAWGDWEAVSAYCKTRAERDIAQILARGESKHNLVAAVNAIPKEQLSMHFSAYQSFLWNMTLEKLLSSYIDDLVKTDGRIMEYHFYGRLDESRQKILRKLVIPTVSYKIPDISPDVDKAVKQVLTERGLKPSDFNLKKVRKAFFKSFLRPAITVPQNLHQEPFEDDDIYPGFLKLKLKFSLPPGCFATMLIKSINIDI